MTDDELKEQFPGFTLDQIKAGLATPAIEMSAWDRRLYDHERSIYGDSLSIGATEYVATEAEIEPFWKSLVGVVCVFVLVAITAVFLYAIGD